MYFIEFLERMMSLTQLIYPSKGLNNNNNNQSFEPGRPDSMSMENFIKNFPAFSNFKIPTMATIKSLFIEKYNEATWKNVHTFLLNSCSVFNTKEFFIVLQCILCIYFPGMALGIVYQYYELDQQTQQLLEKQDKEQDIYQVILQEMQQNRQLQQPQQQSISREYIKQQLEEQGQLQSFNKQSMSQSSPIMMQFAQFIQRFIEQLIQTPQSMLYQIQYQQDCQYINQTIQAMQQQTDQQYIQTQYYQNQNPFSNQEEEIQDQCVIINQYHQVQVHAEQVNAEQVIIVMIQQKSQVLRATTNSTLNNENGGVNNMIITVIKVKLPKEGRQIVQF